MAPESDDEDERTVESLLSDWNEDEDYETAESYQNITSARERLNRKFAFRDKLLKRISKGKHPAFLEMLKYHESLVRAEAFNLLDETGQEQIKMSEEKKSLIEADSLHSETAETAKTTFTESPRKVSVVWNMLLYEIHLAFPGLLALLLFCFAHLSAYEVTQSVIMESVRYLPYDDTYVFGACILFGLLLTRITGGVWDWVSVERHEIAKFDLHNRIRLQFWDAKFHLWFQKRETLKFVLDCMAIYICLVGVSHFQYHIIHPLFKDKEWLIEGLPSHAHDVETPVTLWLQGRMTPECPVDPVDEDCVLMDTMTAEDEWFLSRAISVSSYNALMGGGDYAATPISWLSLHLTISCLCFWLLNKIGFQWD